MRWRLSLRFSLLLLFAVPAAVRAQEQTTRVEIGGEFSTIRQNDASTGDGKNFPGFGGRFDWNINRRFAIESEVDFFPEHSEVVDFRRGGQTLQAVFGVRAKVLQTRHISVFGLVRPGLLHMTDVLETQAPGSSAAQQLAATYFVLNIGGGIEYYPSPRWVLRADIAGNPYRVSPRTVPVEGIPVTYPGKIEDTTRLSFGVAYRPGTLRENEHETEVAGNWDLGGTFSTLMTALSGAQAQATTLYGFGGYASRRIWRVFYFDGGVFYFPHSNTSSEPLYGGPVFQGLAGVKGGIRRNRMGFFGKVRPGVQSYANTLASINVAPPEATTYTFSRANEFVLDLGGIIEFYPSERSTLRIEAGDTHTFYSSRTVNSGGVPVTYDPGMLHTIQIAVGYGWRF